MSIEALKSFLDVTLGIMAIVFRFAIAVGAIATFVYLGHIGYYPSGVDFGDGFFLLWIGLAVGLFYTLLVFVMWCMGITIRLLVESVFSRARKKCRWLDKISKMKYVAWLNGAGTAPPEIRRLGLVIGIVGVLFIVLLSLAPSSPVLKIGLVTYAAVLGLVTPVLVGRSAAGGTSSGSEARAIPVGEVIEGNAQEELGRNKFESGLLRYALLTTLYLFPLLLDGIMPGVLAHSFRMAGARHEGVTLYVEKDLFWLASSTGEGEGQVVDVDSDTYIKIDQVDVLFTGIGTSSVIRISRTCNRPARFVIPNNKFHMKY